MKPIHHPTLIHYGIGYHPITVRPEQPGTVLDCDAITSAEAYHYLNQHRISPLWRVRPSDDATPEKAENVAPAQSLSLPDHVAAAMLYGMPVCAEWDGELTGRMVGECRTGLIVMGLALLGAVGVVGGLVWVIGRWWV